VGNGHLSILTIFLYLRLLQGISGNAYPGMSYRLSARSHTVRAARRGRRVRR